jgi:hypothetical protein
MTLEMIGFEIETHTSWIEMTVLKKPKYGVTGVHADFLKARFLSRGL